MAQINRKCVAGGYLYIINKRKKIQNLPSDEFNKFIELNNLIYEPDYDNINTATIQYSLTYKKSILKVSIKTEHKIEQKVNFVAFLRSEKKFKRI